MSKGRIYKLPVNLTKIPKDQMWEYEGDRFVMLDLWIGDEENEHGSVGSAKVYRGAENEKVKVGNIKPLSSFGKKKEAGDDDLPF